VHGLCPCRVRVRLVEFSSSPTMCADFVCVGSGPCRVRVVEFSFNLTLPVCLPDGLWSLLDKVQPQTHLDPFFVQYITSRSLVQHKFFFKESDLKLLTDFAQTVEFSRPFHQFTTLSEKKWRWSLVLLLFFQFPIMSMSSAVIIRL